jgi:hypothetical protein
MGRFLTRDTWSGDANRPLSFNRWAYTEGNPINLVDPSGLVSCTDSNDADCIRFAIELKRKARQLKTNVEIGNTLPVEALAQLVDYSQQLLGDKQGIMWALTNVLLGVDPNSINVWKLGLKDSYMIFPNSNPYYVGQDWLLYKHDPLLGKRHSEQGDWKDEYWDGTPNQAYHFWYSAATEYYDNHFFAVTANLVHDPYYLEWLCGDDLEKLGFINIDGQSITNHFNETSSQDFFLANIGMEFGSTMWWFGSFPYFSPGNWIRANLSSTDPY